MTTSHPCGGLPISGHHSSLWYCHYHACYWGTAYFVHQTSDDELHEHEVLDYQAGPFDSALDAHAWFSDLGARVLRLDAVPGDLERARAHRSGLDRVRAHIAQPDDVSGCPFPHPELPFPT